MNTPRQTAARARVATTCLLAAIVCLVGVNIVTAMEVKYVPLPGEKVDRTGKAIRSLRNLDRLAQVDDAHKRYLRSMIGEVNLSELRSATAGPATAAPTAGPATANTTKATANKTAPAKTKKAEKAGPRPRIQLAILLDNSGSMSGLINQARSELWTIVNQFATARYDGQIPELEVALYSYGNPPATQLIGLTTDLDAVSERLFSLGISGGSEHCGAVIDKATKELKWSDSNKDLKLIFIAGNERFTQGNVDYRSACKAAISKGIVVNTIHCGDEKAGIRGMWKDGALLADGRFLNINHNAAVAHIEAPQDKKIAELGVKLNETYIPYGTDGLRGARNQAVQDANAANLSTQVLTNRALTKASANYRNGAWCLADAVKSNKVKLGDVKADDLPENMRKMSLEQRRDYVSGKLQEREAIQKQIMDLNKERQSFVAAKRKELAAKGVETLDTAVVKVVREQAAKKKFNLKSADETPEPSKKDATDAKKPE